jgi:hypothetical protein
VRYVFCFVYSFRKYHRFQQGGVVSRLLPGLLLLRPGVGFVADTALVCGFADVPPPDPSPAQSSVADFPIRISP